MASSVHPQPADRRNTASDTNSAFKRISKVAPADRKPSEPAPRGRIFSSLPRSTLDLEKLNDETARKIEGAIGTKWRTIVFILCVGLGLAGLGIYITFEAIRTHLNDLYVLGPSLLAVSIILILIAIVMMVYNSCKIRKTLNEVLNAREEVDQQELDQLAREYDLENGEPEIIPPATSPSGAILYDIDEGEDTTGVLRHVQLVTSNLEGPVVTYPTHAHDLAESEEPVYQMELKPQITEPPSLHTEKIKQVADTSEI